LNKCHDVKVCIIDDMEYSEHHRTSICLFDVPCFL